MDLITRLKFESELAELMFKMAKSLDPMMKPFYERFKKWITTVADRTARRASISPIDLENRIFQAIQEDARSYYKITSLEERARLKAVFSGSHIPNWNPPEIKPDPKILESAIEQLVSWVEGAAHKYAWTVLIELAYKNLKEYKAMLKRSGQLRDNKSQKDLVDDLIFEFRKWFVNNQDLRSVNRMTRLSDPAFRVKAVHL